MDDSTNNPLTPDPTSSVLPEATLPSTPPPSQDNSFASESRESLSNIHDALATFEQEMKAVLTPENFERRFREKRRSLYSKYIGQELGSCLTADVLRQTLLGHADLLPEASKNDVFRAILLEDVMEKAGELESTPIKAAEKKLALVRDIYDAAEKIDPDKGGVTPEWAVRKRREIRGSLAREIVAHEENTKAVESYIASFEQYEVNRISNDDEWKDGDAELARHFRQVMREKERGELHQTEESSSLSTDQVNVSHPESASSSVASVESVPPSPSELITPADVTPEPPVATHHEPAIVAPEPEVVAPVISEPAPTVERRKPEDIAQSSMYRATQRVQNINPGPVGTFFTGVLKGKVASSGVVTTAPSVPDVAVEASVEPEQVAQVSTPKQQEASSSEDTIEQTLRAAIEQIRAEQEEGTPAPKVIDHSGEPIQSAGSDTVSSDSEHATNVDTMTHQDQGEEKPVEKKRGFFGKLFGR